MVVRWTFSDGSTTYTFEINPNEGGSPARKRGVGFSVTAAPDGGVLVYEKRSDPRTLSFSGVVLTQAHYDALDEWSDKHEPITLTDDLSRSFTVILTSFEPRRVRSALYPWKHTYTCEAIVLAAA
jgi:hypothetical protein